MGWDGGRADGVVMVRYVKSYYLEFWLHFPYLLFLRNFLNTLRLNTIPLPKRKMIRHDLPVSSPFEHTLANTNITSPPPLFIRNSMVMGRTSVSISSKGPKTLTSFCPLLNKSLQERLRVIFSLSFPVSCSNFSSVQP